MHPEIWSTHVYNHAHHFQRGASEEYQDPYLSLETSPDVLSLVRTFE